MEIRLPTFKKVPAKRSLIVFWRRRVIDCQYFNVDKGGIVSHRIQLVCTVSLALMLASCGQSSEKLVDAKGVLKVDGKPLSGARLAFAPIDGSKSRGGMAITGDDGSFTVLEYTHNKPGIPPGSYVVTVSKLVKRDGSDVPKGTSPTSVGAIEMFPIWWTRPAAHATYNKVVIPETGMSNLEVAVDTKSDPSRPRIPTGQPTRAAGAGRLPGT